MQGLRLREEGLVGGHKFVNQNWAEQDVPPKPTALVGNLLTGKGDVIEVVKVR